MKKVLALILTVFMLFGTAAISSSADVYSGSNAKQFIEDEETSVKVSHGSGPIHINMWTFTTEVSNMVEYYISMHPDFGNRYTVDVTIAPTSGGMYQTGLDSALAGDRVDIYAAEGAFVTKYTKGDMRSYAAPYDSLGIDAESEIADAQIAQYIVDIGRRDSDGKVMALAYQSSSSALIYRASIAKEVFGSDDPSYIEKVVGGGTGSYDSFWKAGIKLKENGYPLVSGPNDVWKMIEGNTSTGWIDRNRKTLLMSPERLAFFEYAKAIKQRGWSNGTSSWTPNWYADMMGVSQEGKTNKPAFCFIGPSWLIQFVMKGNCGGETIGEGTYGDWRVCQAPAAFCWGGTWILGSKTAANDSDKRSGVAELIRWINLDTSDTGLQYLWANGLYSGNSNTKDCVASTKVLANSDGSIDFLGGQNMYSVYMKANQTAKGNNLTEYDDSIASLFTLAAEYYANGEKTYEQAMQQFCKEISSNYLLTANSIPGKPSVSIPDSAEDIPAPDNGGKESTPEEGGPDDSLPGPTDGGVQYLGMEPKNLVLIILIIAGVSLLIVVGLIIAIILIVKSNKKKAKAANAAPQPVQPVVPQQPVAPQQPVQQQPVPPVQQQPVPQYPVQPATPQPVAPQQPAAPAAPAVKKVFCPYCGAEQDPASLFCDKCGGKLK